MLLEIFTKLKRFLYKHGIFEPAYPLLEVVIEYYLHHKDCELILSDLYGAKGALQTESNHFQGAFDNFHESHAYLQASFAKGFLASPDMREVNALGNVGNGCQGLERYPEAEDWYRKALDAWENVPGNKAIYVGNLSFCLGSQGKLTKAEELVSTVIIDRKDTSTFRQGLYRLCLLILC